MALSKNLEDLLKHMQPADAAAQREIWEKNPAIAKSVDEYFVPQAEFNRRLAEKDTVIATHKKTADDWKDWADKNKPKHEQLLTDYEKVNKELIELKAKQSVTRTEGETGVVVDEEKLMERVEARLGGKPATEARITAIVAEESAKLLAQTKELLDNTRKDFLEKTFPQVTAFQADLFEVMQDYQQEYGKKLDRAEFSKFMQENRIVDPKEAYQKFTDASRREKEIAAEVKKRTDAELAKHNLPGVSSTTGEVTDMGPLQLKIAGQTPKFEEGTALGDLSASALAAKELREAGRV